MGIRKCIYTGKAAGAKDSVIPRKCADLHNWANKAPISLEYKDLKKDNLPTEIEMEANRIFHKLELAKNDVIYYEAKLLETQNDVIYYETKLLEIQSEINKSLENMPRVEKQSKKDREIEQAFYEKEKLESVEEGLAELIKSKKDKLFWE